MDPQGVEIRKRKRLRRRQYLNKGPNFLWHVDSYDKLKPYGICINGCIDGFSRHIIWLRVGSTSSDPKVIGGYYLDVVKEIGGCPLTVRCDMGNENKTLEHLQVTLNEVFKDGTCRRPPFIVGKSTHNQRIEAWWGVLRKHSAQFWMNLFQTLKEDNLFDGSFLDKSLIQFCFANLIQRDMDQVILEWNVHRISRSRNSISPTGKPAIMFEMPSLYNADNYLIPVPSFATDEMSIHCAYNSYPCDKDFYDLCNILISENMYSIVVDPYAAVNLYTNLRHDLLDIFAN
ncbi:uncharacterized protein LOC116163746 isoform X2 [Photinus pyralis]|uniref:uncharacterized protein LOC116163746 isoform X2 n=1 Tax=Photinus pyralis TaxID=7054 RepID=UPI0012671B6D|nr:uncharacterized protein LOC116163746 isoform X2 [Photinus pyralis]